MIDTRLLADLEMLVIVHGCASAGTESHAQKKSGPVAPHVCRGKVRSEECFVSISEPLASFTPQQRQPTQSQQAQRRRFGDGFYGGGFAVLGNFYRPAFCFAEPSTSKLP